jgi:broad specificity phosphatase PhoE
VSTLGVAAKHNFEIVVVRHGRTAWNATGRFQGRTDIPLDDEGRAQAGDVGRMLAGERFDAAVTSDLARARETAEIVLGERDVALAIDPRWGEMRFGTWEGLTWSEIVARQPELAGRSSTSPRYYTPPGGESFDELCARVAEALAALDARVHDGARALVATHAGPLHALLRVALGQAEADALGIRFAPASCTRLALGPDGTRLLDLNRTAPDAAAR